LFDTLEKTNNRINNRPEGKGPGMGMPWPSGKPKNMSEFGER